jgi:hypothetical protein
LAEKPARRWKRIAADAAQQAAVLHALQVLDERLLGHPELARRPAVRLGLHGQVALRGAHHVAVALVEVLLVELDGLLDDGGLRQVLRGARHLQVHPDLEELERRELADRLGARELLQDVERPLQAELGVLLDREREPHVEVVVAQVVVRDARVGVDDLRRPPRVLRVDLGRHEHGAVAEGARVEDRRDLADDAGVQEPRTSARTSASGAPRAAATAAYGRGLEGERALHEVQEALVALGERDGRAVLALADLRRHCSHRAASFAW